jgi:hypothetical protein
MKHSLIIVLLATLVIFPTCKEDCEPTPCDACNSCSIPNAVEWKVSDGGNDHFYEAVLAEGDITWEKAQEAALVRGDNWHLATITSEAENEFVKSLFSGNAAFFNCCLSQVASGPWIGATSSSNASNDWTWITGENFDFTQWGPREPFGNGDHISYAQFGNAKQVAWNDIPSGHPNSPRSYILECTISD